MKEQKFWSPYVAGVGLGLTLLLAFVLVGRGLGASGAMMRFDVWFMNLIMPDHMSNSAYFSKYL